MIKAMKYFFLFVNQNVFPSRGRNGAGKGVNYYFKGCSQKDRKMMLNLMFLTFP